MIYYPIRIRGEVNSLDNEMKKRIMMEIEKKGEMFKQLSPIQYRIRCPICGDSQKKLDDAHCYIKCVYNSDEPIQFNCFLCNHGGRISAWFLNKLGASKSIIKQAKKQINHTIQYIDHNDIEIITGTPILDSPQTRFLERKLGAGFTEEDYQRFKIIWDMKEIYKYVTNKKVKNTLPSNLDRIQFLSDDKSMILSRSFLDDERESQWRKIKIFSSVNRSYYFIKTSLDLFTSETITVNIAEGILDVLSIYKNFNDGENSIYLAILGSNYIGGVDYIISKGFIGSNIILKIYIDRDNRIDKKSILEVLKKYKWIFGKIFVYENLKYKDVGTTMDRIKLKEYRI